MADNSVYPDAIDNFGTVSNDVNFIEAKDINQLNDAVKKIETELGTDPKGTYTDVKTRLDNISKGKVAVDDDATPGYIGATADTGVLRTTSPITRTDGGDYITLGIQDASTSDKGAASFDSDNFDVTSGAVSIKDDGIKENHIDFGTGEGQVSAGDVPIVDSGGYYTSDNVEGALREIGGGSGGGGAWELITHYEVTGSAEQYHDFDISTADYHKFEITLNLLNGNESSTTAYYLYLNEDYTEANYVRLETYTAINGASTITTRSATASIGGGGSLAPAMQTSIRIEELKKTADGYADFNYHWRINRTVGSTGIRIGVGSTYYNQSVDEIEHIRVYSSAVNGLGIGSTITIIGLKKQ